MSEALILASTNKTEYDELYEFSTRKLQVQNMLCTQIVYLFLLWHSEQFMYTTCSELVVFMYWTGKSMNNILSYCGLVDARISASDKDLPVNKWKKGNAKRYNASWPMFIFLELLFSVAGLWIRVGNHQNFKRLK